MTKWMVRPAFALVLVLLVAACGGEELGAPVIDPNRTGDNAVPPDQIGVAPPTPSGTVSVSPGAAPVVCVPGPRAQCAKAILRSAALRDADLRSADFAGADLTGADLRGADLRKADLSGATLSSADLTGADMRGSDFSNAKLRYTNLSDVDMAGADGREGQLAKARLCETILPDGTRNVRNCLDLAPSPAPTTDTGGTDVGGPPVA